MTIARDVRAAVTLGLLCLRIAFPQQKTSDPEKFHRWIASGCEKVTLYLFREPIEMPIAGMGTLLDTRAADPLYPTCYWWRLQACAASGEESFSYSALVAHEFPDFEQAWSSYTLMPQPPFEAQQQMEKFAQGLEERHPGLRVEKHSGLVFPECFA